MRSRLYGDIDATETVENNYDVSLRIGETQENSVAFEKMSVSV